jgi:hypothetical protein
VLLHDSPLTYQVLLVHQMCSRGVAGV